jgi:hypothetical protein
VTYQGTTPPVVDTAVVPGNGSTTLYQPAQGQLPDGYTGSAVVAASPGMRLVGMVNAVRTGEHAATNYTVGGAQPLSAFLVVPLAMHASDDWETSIQVQNPTDSATRLVTTFYAENGTLVYRTDEALRGGATRKFDLAGMPEIPDGFRGSAVIQSLSGPPLTAVVNETSR